MGTEEGDGVEAEEEEGAEETEGLDDVVAEGVEEGEHALRLYTHV